MKKTMKRLTALTALTILTACDYADRSDLRKERADGLYKSAMEDYRAGRIDAAVAGFKKVVGKDPANASARFQLACLLQDAKADHLGAYCCYCEYLLQHPESDKAPLARERQAKCEVELAKFLAKKHGLTDTDGFAKEIATLKGDLRTSENRLAAAEKATEELRLRVTALGAERERLLAIVKGGTAEMEAEIAQKKPSVKDVKELLEEDDDSSDRIKMSADVALLKAEETSELSTGSDILPAHRPSVTNAVKKAERPPVEKRHIPETYVVQEGDTLYGIAKRFYGKLSVWKQIRDMNKALISADGRVHVGDTLRLPRE